MDEQTKLRSTDRAEEEDQRDQQAFPTSRKRRPPRQEDLYGSETKPLPYFRQFEKKRRF